MPDTKKIQEAKTNSPQNTPSGKYARRKDTIQVPGAYGTNLTYSGCDIIPVVYGSNPQGQQKVFVIGDIATLTYSIHQDKGAVRTLGRSAPRGFVRGPETIAGTMIFNVFDRQVLWELAKDNRSSATFKTRHASSLPMFDVILYFVNEAGHESALGIFGITVVDEGQSHSVEDTYVENTMSYVALRVEPLEPINRIPDKATFQRARQTAIDSLGRKGSPFDYSYLPEVSKI